MKIPSPKELRQELEEGKLVDPESLEEAKRRIISILRRDPLKKEHWISYEVDWLTKRMLLPLQHQFEDAGWYIREYCDSFPRESDTGIIVSSEPGFRRGSVK
jgi:hypothetical protein